MQPSVSKSLTTDNVAHRPTCAISTKRTGREAYGVAYPRPQGRGRQSANLAPGAGMPAMHRKWGVGQAFSALIDETLGETLTITVMVDASKPFKSVEVWGAFAGDRVKTASILRASLPWTLKSGDRITRCCDSAVF